MVDELALRQPQIHHLQHQAAHAGVVWIIHSSLL